MTSLNSGELPYYVFNCRTETSKRLHYILFLVRILCIEHFMYNLC